MLDTRDVLPLVDAWVSGFVSPAFAFLPGDFPDSYAYHVERRIIIPTVVDLLGLRLYEMILVSKQACLPDRMDQQSLLNLTHVGFHGGRSRRR